MTTTKPTHEAHAREVLGMSEAWEVYRWEVKGPGIYVEGGVCDAVIKSGPAKGHRNWALRDKQFDAAITLSNEKHAVDFD